MTTLPSIAEREWRRFVDQNDATIDGLTTSDEATLRLYVEHHAGGLMVAGRYVEVPASRQIPTVDGGPLYVKMHDTWGGVGPAGEEVLVHVYDPDGEAPGLGEGEIWCRNGHEGLAHFLDDDACITAYEAGLR
jgi:hypothetical protein